MAINDSSTAGNGAVAAVTTDTDKIPTAIGQAASDISAAGADALAAAGGNDDLAAKAIAAASRAADSGLKVAASTASDLASTIRERGSGVEGPVGEFAGVAASAIERGGIYLSEADATSLIERGQELVIRNRRLTIISAILLAIVLVMLIVRVVRGSGR